MQEMKPTGSSPEERKTLRSLMSLRGEIYAFILSLVRNPHEAEELFQDLSIVVLEKARAGEEIRNFRAWIKGVAKNLVLNHFRKGRQRRTSTLPPEEMVDLIVDTMFFEKREKTEQLDQLKRLVDRCLSQMRTDLADLIRSRFIDNMPYAELARETGKSEVLLRTNLKRARLALQRCVEKKHPSPSEWEGAR